MRNHPSTIYHILPKETQATAPARASPIKTTSSPSNPAAFSTSPSSKDTTAVLVFSTLVTMPYPRAVAPPSPVEMGLFAWVSSSVSYGGVKVP